MMAEATTKVVAPSDAPFVETSPLTPAVESIILPPARQANATALSPSAMAEATPKIVAPAEAPSTEMLPLTPVVGSIIPSPPTVPTPALHEAKSTAVLPLASAEATATPTVMEAGPSTPAVQSIIPLGIVCKAHGAYVCIIWAFKIYHTNWEVGSGGSF